MSLPVRTDARISFFTFLTASYLAVFVVCSLLLYAISRHLIAESARAFDRDDVRYDSLEYAEILHNNPSGQWLAEEIAIEHNPASTLFAIRILNPDGTIAYAASQPADLAFPGGWQVRRTDRPPPAAGCREVYIPAYHRYLQLCTTWLADGRILQVAKSTKREHRQKRIVRSIVLSFLTFASVFVIGTSVVLMLLTLRPIRNLTALMSSIIQTGKAEPAVSPARSLIREFDTLSGCFNQLLTKNTALIRAMEDTLDNVAHDFRTPLMRLRSVAESTLALTETQQSREMLTGTLAGIIEECDIARLQLQNLLDVRSMESGVVKLDVRPFDLRATLLEVVDLYSVLAEDKALTLSFDAPDVPVLIEGDQARLSQVFANLLDNAVKYTKRQGRVDLCLVAHPDHVLFRITDSGIGIPESEHALVWRRLYRSPVARSEKGNGLGLSLVKVIVEAHGGAVELRSSLGKGTTVSVTLPLTPSRTQFA